MDDSLDFVHIPSLQTVSPAVRSELVLSQARAKTLHSDLLLKLRLAQPRPLVRRSQLITLLRRRLVRPLTPLDSELDELGKDAGEIGEEAVLVFGVRRHPGCEGGILREGDVAARRGVSEG